VRPGCFFAVCLLVGTVVVFLSVSPVSGASGDSRPADTNPPTGKATYPLPGAWTNYGYITLTVQFTDPDGISLYSLSIAVDGMALNPSWSGFVLYAPANGLPDGLHTAEARASDQAGNGPTIVRWSFGVDTIRPVVNITAPSGNPKLTGGSVTLAWTGTDVGSGIAGYSVQLDNGPSVDVGNVTSFPFPELAPGVHYFRVDGSDLAGNYDGASAMATVPSGPPNTIPVSVVIPDQIPPWAIVLVVINAAEAAGVVWLALRRRGEPPRGDKPAP